MGLFSSRRTPLTRLDTIFCSPTPMARPNAPPVTAADGAQLRSPPLVKPPKLFWRYWTPQVRLKLLFAYLTGRVAFIVGIRFGFFVFAKEETAGRSGCECRPQCKCYIPDSTSRSFSSLSSVSDVLRTLPLKCFNSSMTLSGVALRTRTKRAEDPGVMVSSRR